jgi:hypothetical protein
VCVAILSAQETFYDCGKFIPKLPILGEYFICDMFEIVDALLQPAPHSQKAGDVV